MNIEHYQVKNLNNKGLAWYGLERIGCPEIVRVMTKDEKKYAHGLGYFSERECEVDCFLQVLTDFKEEKFTMLDLGTGWGEWSMALGGVISKELIPLKANKYWTLAVESDFNFYGLVKRNLEDNGINGLAVHRAVGRQLGLTRVNGGTISNCYCGGGMTFDGYFSDSKIKALALGLYSYLRKQSYTVEMVDIDYLVSSYFGGHVNLLVMDIQGAEILALEGAKESLDDIDYLMIGTHGKSVHNKVSSMLKSHYDLVVDAPPNQFTKINNDYRVVCRKGQDGILLCKSKRI
jgi:FkbM family methyltransferase